MTFNIHSAGTECEGLDQSASFAAGRGLITENTLEVGDQPASVGRDAAPGKL